MKKWQLITILQMFSQSSFSPQCWVITFPSSTSSKIHHCLRCSRLARSIVQVQGLHSHRGSHVEDQRLARLHQVCAQHQGQVCMINSAAFQNQQDLVIQRFRSASSRIRRAFTPPRPLRGSENQDSGHSDVQVQIQENQNHVIQNVSATSRWWAFIALIMSIMHFMVQGYQFSRKSSPGGGGAGPGQNLFWP